MRTNGVAEAGTRCGSAAPEAMRILVVEDERKVASFIRQGLEEEGYAVDVAPDGATAVDLALGGTSFTTSSILDVMLPKRDGFAVLRRCASSACPAPVLMLTARDRVPDRVTGLDLGADDYLTKPFVFDEFLARVRVLLRRSRGQRAPDPPAGRPGASIPRRAASPAASRGRSR